MTAKDKILVYLKEAGKPLALHEMNIPGVSQNAAGTRLPELAKIGLVVGSFRQGKNFKEWGLVPAQMELGVGA